MDRGLRHGVIFLHLRSYKRLCFSELAAFGTAECTRGFTANSLPSIERDGSGPVAPGRGTAVHRSLDGPPTRRTGAGRGAADTHGASLFQRKQPKGNSNIRAKMGN
ncbi:hypothetical protein EYF80_041271 [Liparis tanakae]|uniref:Uncharacterized protein n=1 Tax=Liparis tanakae TaxID=230148 RepID=A0A4Z2G4M9_9TELE|nr:hypothetical protein EYF80_041271 [Liparis tanakae]